MWYDWDIATRIVITSLQLVSVSAVIWKWMLRSWFFSQIRSFPFFSYPSGTNYSRLRWSLFDDYSSGHRVSKRRLICTTTRCRRPSHILCIHGTSWSSTNYTESDGETITRRHVINTDLLEHDFPFLGVDDPFDDKSSINVFSTFQCSRFVDVTQDIPPWDVREIEYFFFPYFFLSSPWFLLLFDIFVDFCFSRCLLSSMKYAL